MQKTNFKTRLLALLTAVFMVIMCVPFAAFADGSVNVKFKGDTAAMTGIKSMPRKLLPLPLTRLKLLNCRKATTIGRAITARKI